MGLFDFLGGSEEKRVERLVAKATQKYGPPENRQKALEQLVDLATPEAVTGLLKRFTVTAEPGITDREEKDYVYRAVLDFGEEAVGPLKVFVRNSESAIAWALKGLTALVPPPDLVDLCLQTLQKLGAEYTRDPEKKVVLLTQLLDMQDERIARAVLPFMEDPSDDVKIAASKLLARSKEEEVRLALLESLVRESGSKRVVAALVESLALAGASSQGYKEKIAPLVQDPYFIDKDAVIKKRG